MEKNSKPKRPGRQATRTKKLMTDRVDLFVANYVKNKYATIYKEAVQFHDNLRQTDPEKRDLRKSWFYKAWIKDNNIIRGQFNNFKLNINLMSGDNLQPKSQSEPDVEITEAPGEGELDVEVETIEMLAEGEAASTSETTVRETEGELDVEVETIEMLAEGEAVSTIETTVRETIGENILQPMLEPPIPDNLYNQILNELRADEDICRIMRAIEDDMLVDEW